jgi:DNA polymerase-3 subunit chi
MGAVYFYHLTQSPLEATLPSLLDKALGAGWRVAVRGTDAARLDWLDKRLWMVPDDGFLPHGMAGDAMEQDQPVLLTLAQTFPNGATCLVAVDGAEVSVEEVQAMERVMILFDGTEGSAVQAARVQWKALTGGGCKAQYWSQESGRWEKKAEA